MFTAKYKTKSRRNDLKAENGNENSPLIQKLKEKKR